MGGARKGGRGGSHLLEGLRAAGEPVAGLPVLRVALLRRPEVVLRLEARATAGDMVLLDAVALSVIGGMCGCVSHKYQIHEGGKIFNVNYKLQNPEGKCRRHSSTGRAPEGHIFFPWIVLHVVAINS